MTAVLAPRAWAAHLLTVAALVAAAALGGWQYGAWQDQRTAEARDLTRLEPVPLTGAMGPDDPFPGTLVGHPVTVEGTWVPGGSVLVSGREQDGAEGYWVVTPLAVGGPDAPAVPVVRGWTAEPDLPEAPRGTASVVGWLQPPEGSGAADPDPTDDVLPQVRVADLVQHVDQDLYGAYVVARVPARGLAPATLDQLPDVGGFTALRNLLYAIEWWIFGAFAGVVWWRYVQDARERERSRPAPDHPLASDA